LAVYGESEGRFYFQPVVIARPDAVEALASPLIPPTLSYACPQDRNRLRARRRCGHRQTDLQVRAAIAPSCRTLAPSHPCRPTGRGGADRNPRKLKSIRVEILSRQEQRYPGRLANTPRRRSPPGAAR